MKTNKTLTILAFLLLITGIPASTLAAESGELIVNAKYFMYNNKIPFVEIKAQTKVEKKLQPVPNISFQLYLDNISDSQRIGNVKTNFNGNATVTIPPALKTLWDASPKHTIICQSAATKAFEENEQEVEITQAKLLIDTLNEDDVRSIVATLMELTDKGWVPVNETDIRIGVKRLGGILSAGTAEAFTTDAEGKAVAAFERDSLPGDNKGILTLVAKVEDNEQYGNLVMEMNAPWGEKATKGPDSFNERTLWATRDKAPYWLLLIANGIIITVWGTIIYLILQLFKIKKLGNKTI